MAAWVVVKMTEIAAHPSAVWGVMGIGGTVAIGNEMQKALTGIVIVAQKVIVTSDATKIDCQRSIGVIRGRKKSAEDVVGCVVNELTAPSSSG